VGSGVEPQPTNDIILKTSILKANFFLDPLWVSSQRSGFVPPGIGWQKRKIFLIEKPLLFQDTSFLPKTRKVNIPCSAQKSGYKQLSFSQGKLNGNVHWESQDEYDCQNWLGQLFPMAAPFDIFIFIFDGRPEDEHFHLLKSWGVIDPDFISAVFSSPFRNCRGHENGREC
jgi:hypothetical protein